MCIQGPKPQKKESKASMRSLIRHKAFSFNLSCQLICFHFSRLFQLYELSSLAKPSRGKKSLETLEKQAEINDFRSLFSEITDILGADNFLAYGSSSGTLLMKETQVKDKEIKKNSLSSHSICKNFNFLIEKEATSITNGTQLIELVGTDVSPIVHKVTEIVRARSGPVSMEERLENLGYHLDLEVVDKVLKRCFKVPNLALRFFDWVKFRYGFCHTTNIYNTLLIIAGEAKKFGLVEKLVEEMEEHSCENDIKTWTILISLYGKSKLIGKALMVYDKMIKSGCVPDALVYKIMLRALCTAGKADIAMEFYKEMIQKGIALDMGLYEMLLSCVARSRDTAGLHLISDEMIKISQIPVHIVHGCVLKCFCIAGRIREALEFLRDLKNNDIILGCEYFETLLKGLCRAGRTEDALEILEIMKSKNLVHGGIYAIIINGYLKRNDVSKALDMLQSMKESGHLPTTSTYTELMQHLFKSNQYKKGCKLYNEMLERGVELDGVTITAMVAGHVSQNRISEAWKVFKSMENKGIGPSWKSYSIFIKELCRNSRTGEVLKLLDEMQASRIVIGDKLFHWVTTYLEKKGDIHNVEKIKQMQGSHKLCPQNGDVSCDVAIRGQKMVAASEQGKHHCSVELHSEAYDEQDLQETSRILLSSTNWCLVQEKLEKCTMKFTPRLIEEVLYKCHMNGNTGLRFFSWVGKQAGYRHTKETYNMAIKLAGKGKDFKHMRNLFFEMRRNGYPITSDTWTIIIMQYGRTGLTEIALNIFDEMKANKCNPTTSTYKSLITTLCGRKGRKADEAVKIFHEMISAGCAPDKDLVETYLACLYEVGKLLDARNCMAYMQKVGFSTPLSYSLNIRALCRAGRLEEAIALANEIGTQRATLDQYTFGSIVHGLLQRGQLEKAMNKVDSMRQADIKPSIHVYTSLMVYFLKEKDIKKALEIFQKMQEEGCEPTIVTYSALIRGYMNMGESSDAWDLFNSMKEKGISPDFKVYSMFITCLSRVGKSVEAMQLLYEMLNRGIVPSSVNFRTVFYGLNREGKHEFARNVMHKKLDLTRNRKFFA